MKKLTLIPIFFFLMSMMLSAQDADFINYDKALLQAKDEGKILVVQFAGSDWCSPCIRLDEKILETEAFKTYREQFVWLKADFPRKKDNRLSKDQQQHNDALAEKYNSKGSFPLLVFIDGDEKVLGTIGYQPVSVEDYKALIDQLIQD